MEPVVNPYFDQTIRRIYDAGANLATPEMEALAPADMLWERFASGCEDEPRPEGVVRFCNHERSGSITAFIDFTIVPWIKENGEVWLLPVFDDEEYISWDLFFVVGTEAEVLEKLKAI
jgi:hypothetical protein